jgi:hypothetical protein
MHGNNQVCELIVLLHQIVHPAHRSYCLRSTCGSLYKKTPAGGALYNSKTTDINQNIHQYNKSKYNLGKNGGKQRREKGALPAWINFGSNIQQLRAQLVNTLS